MDILECSSYVLIKDSMGIEFSSSKYNVKLPEHIKRFFVEPDIGDVIATWVDSGRQAVIRQ